MKTGSGQKVGSSGSFEISISRFGTVDLDLFFCRSSVSVPDLLPHGSNNLFFS